MAASSSASTQTKHVAILGAGGEHTMRPVIGLTSALEILRSSKDYRVHIFARDLSSSTQGLASREWASPWAGCNWCSFATPEDTVTQQRDRLTYQRWMEMIQQRTLPREAMEKMTFTHLLASKADGSEAYTKGELWFENFVEDFQYHPTPSDGYRHPRITYESICVNTPLYLAYLVSQLEATQRISFHQVDTVPSLASLFTDPSLRDIADPQLLVINASGLGARYLSDVSDDQVYAIRGQTVLVRGPPSFSDSPECIMSLTEDKDHEPIYIIPRGASGEVILGGTFGADEWEAEVKDADTQRILRRCFEICPRLLDRQNSKGARTAADTSSDTEEWRGLYDQVISVNVGLRPARRGDITRVELDAVKVAAAQGTNLAPALRPVLHCYGAGKAGFQGSVGIAHEVLELVQGHFEALAS